MTAQAGGETDADVSHNHRDEAQSLGAQREIHDSGRTGQIHTEVVSEKHRVSAQLGWGEVMPLEGAA